MDAGGYKLRMMRAERLHRERVDKLLRDSSAKECGGDAAPALSDAEVRAASRPPKEA